MIFDTIFLKNLNLIFSDQGSSRLEPGKTPRSNMTLSFYTWSEFEKNCGYSRLYGGVNFPDSITNIKALAVQMGRRALDFVRYHVNLQASSASTNSVNSVRNNGENSYYSFSRERDQLTKNPKTMNYKYYVEYQKK